MIGRLLRQGLLRQGLLRQDLLRQDLLRQEHGFVLVFFAVAIPAFLGLAGLAVDGARLMTLDTQLAGVADAAALAAASALDRTDGAIGRARDAAAALVNRAASAERNPDTPRLSLRFAASLGDLRDPRYTLPETASAQAVYVEATTAEYALGLSLLQAVGAAASPIRRRAIAEAQYYACDVTPAVMCHSDPDRFAAGARPGRQYLLRMDGSLNDGAVVLLDKPDDQASRTTLRTLASNAPAFCFMDNVALRRTIAAQDFDDAVNIRFDQYFNGMAPVALDLAQFPPAPNVIKGRHQTSCASPPIAADIDPPYHLPRDQAFRFTSGRSLRFAAAQTPYDLGLGDWQLMPALGGSSLPPVGRAIDEYVAWNHGDKDESFRNALRTSPTRYGIYLRELGLDEASEDRPVRTVGNALAGRTMPTGGPLSGPDAARRESPFPICYPGTQPATDARRRILYLSVADCRNFSPRAATLSRHVAKVFLTEPADGGAMLVELVSMLTPRRDDGKLRPVVQLVETR